MTLRELCAQAREEGKWLRFTYFPTGEFYHPDDPAIKQWGSLDAEASTYWKLVPEEIALLYIREVLTRKLYKDVYGIKLE